MKQITFFSCFLCFVMLTANAQSLSCSASDLGGPSTKFSSLDTVRSRGLADNYYLWDNGATISVKFLSGNAAQQAIVKSNALEWEKYANIHFRFVGPKEDANVRVLLGTENGHNSYVGMLCNLIPQENATMNLDTMDLGKNKIAWQRTVQHEFGHVLGLLHEHFSPVSGIKWNKEEIYKRTMVTSHSPQPVWETYPVSYTNGSKYDNKSIMHFPILSWMTLDGYSVPWNNEISQGDKNILATLYPKSGNRENEVSRFAAINYNSFLVLNNENKNGLSIFPSVDVKSTGKAGKIYFCVLFYDEEGYGVEDEDGNYAYGSTVAAVRSSFLQNGETLVANKSGKTDFELFIPYNELHLKEGMHKLFLQFRLVQVTDDGDVKYIYQSDVQPLTLKMPSLKSN